MLLIRALEEKDVTLARELLSRGCPVDRPRAVDGVTPLLAAAKAGLLAELEALLAARACRRPRPPAARSSYFVGSALQVGRHAHTRARPRRRRAAQG